MNKTVKNSTVYLAGTIIMGLLGFASTMVLTRMLTPQVYAMYGLLTTFVTTASMFISFGYDSAYMRFYYKHNFSQKKFMLMSLKVPVIVFFVFLVLVIEPTKTIITYIFGDRLSYFSIAILLLYILFSFIHRFTQLTARMEEKAFNYVISCIVSRSGFLTLIMAVYFLFKNVSFDWILISFMLCNIASTAINFVVFTTIAKKVSEQTEQVNDKDLFLYGFPYMLNNVLILIVPLAEKLIIRDVAGWNVLSIYTAAAIFQTVMLMIAQTITNIWNPIVFKYCDDEKKFKPLLHEFGIMSAIGVTFCLAGCILLRRWLVLFLDENYYTVFVIAPAILYGSCLHILSLIYSVGIDIKKKTGLLILIPIIQVVISVALCYILIPKLGLVGVAISILTSLSVSKIFKMCVGLRLYNTDIIEWKAAVLCAAGIIAAIITLFSTSFISDAIVCVSLIGIVIAIVNKELFVIIKKIIISVKGMKKNS